MSPKTQTAVSDFNLQKLSTANLKQHIKGSVKQGTNIALFGRRGSGKTEMSKQSIKEMGLHEQYLNMSVIERTDMGGYPDVLASHRGSEFVNFLMPSFYKTMMQGDKKVVLLLDEVDKADPSLWAPLLEITQFRHINGVPLPNLHACIMTGNLISEGGSRPSLPLLDRAEKYLLEVDVRAWLEWAATSNHIHPAVYAYIYDNNSELLGAVDPEDRYADASPRGWERASQCTTFGEKEGWDSDFITTKVNGCVGKEAGIKYVQYFNHYRELIPMVNDLFNGVVKETLKKYDELSPSKKLITCMIAGNRFSSLLSEKETVNLKETEFFTKFIRHADKETALIVMRNQIGQEAIMKHKMSQVAGFKEIIADLRDTVFGTSK